MSEKFIRNPDGLTNPDELIPRCARNGLPNTHSEVVKKNFSFQGIFGARVRAAMVLLNNHVSPADVQRVHGGAVLRQALHELGVRER